MENIENVYLELTSGCDESFACYGDTYYDDGYVDNGSDED